MKKTKKYKLELTENQLRCLESLLWCNPCDSDCCYEENYDKDIDCSECECHKAHYELHDIVDRVKKEYEFKW